MIKRPLHARLSEPVLAERKFTTIRDNPWPIGKPIMLYNWSGKAYRSKQVDVAAVVVLTTEPIIIRNTPEGMRYSISRIGGKMLWEAEGFDSGEEMDDWFSAKIRPSQTVEKHLMRFRTWKGGDA